MKRFNLKFSLLTAILIVAGGALYAQPMAYESAVQYNKSMQVAAATDFNYPQKNVEDGLKSVMKKRGYSAKSSKGFLIFNGIMDIQTGSQMDFIFKVDRKNKMKDRSTVYLFAEGSSVDMLDAHMMNTLKLFLENIYPEIDAYYLEQDIAAQKKIVEKEQKDYDKLIKNKDNLLKQKEKIESQLQKNDENIAQEKNELENQQKILDVLISRKK
jgi:hypothetical protein